jgi:hypothetical protein
LLRYEADTAQKDEQSEKLFGVKGRAEFIQNVRDIAPQSAPKPTQKQIAMNAAVPVVRFGIIEQLPASTDTSGLDAKVQQGFQAQRPGEPSYVCVYPAYENADIQAIKTSINDVVVPAAMQARSNIKGPKLLLGLVGDSNDRKQLRTHVDRRTDILLVDVNKEHLQDLYKEPPTDPYLPLTIRAKTNFMLGGINFATNVLAIPSGKDLSRLMIVGAHIKRPVEDWTKYPPSITTVVASKDSCSPTIPRLSAHTKDVRRLR